jgi:ubiquitin C-terminal hydrolase
VEPEKLEGGNQYKCGDCNKKVDAEKGMTFESLPAILTLQLKRFLYDMTGGSLCMRVCEYVSVCYACGCVCSDLHTLVWINKPI